MIRYLKCSHGIELRYPCLKCEEEKKKLGNYKSDLLKALSNEVPVRRGCPNSPNPCFCTGACQEIIGYRDKYPDEDDTIKLTI